MIWHDATSWEKMIKAINNSCKCNFLCWCSSVKKYGLLFTSCIGAFCRKMWFTVHCWKAHIKTDRLVLQMHVKISQLLKKKQLYIGNWWKLKGVLILHGSYTPRNKVNWKHKNLHNIGGTNWPRMVWWRVEMTNMTKTNATINDQQIKPAKSANNDGLHDKNHYWYQWWWMK